MEHNPELFFLPDDKYIEIFNNSIEWKQNKYLTELYILIKKKIRINN